MTAATLAPPVFPAPAEDYPLPKGPAGPLTRRDAAWLVGLLVLAFLPRAVAALRLDVVCDDAYFYLAVTQAYERGDTAAAVRGLNVNVYPVLLAALHGLGFDLITTAKAWSVVAATLTILPLFGWVRRILDVRVALAACGIYAVHPEFVTLSAEPLRDPTFWLLTALSLYLTWRAAAERRAWLFVAAGVVLAAAAHTRTEGWLLVLPAALWPLVRWREAATERWRLAAGTAGLFAMTPLFVVAFNVTALAEHDRWEWGKLEHFKIAAAWAAGAEPVAPQAPQTIAAAELWKAEGSTAEPVDFPRPARDRRRAGDVVTRETGDTGVLFYAEQILLTLEPVVLLLMLAGSVGWPRLLVRKEHLVLSALAAAVLFAVWGRLSAVGAINGRYFLMCFFPCAGAAGLGLAWLLSGLERAWRATSRPGAAVAAGVAATVLGGLHVADAVTESHPTRQIEAEHGRLLGRRLGQVGRIAVRPGVCRLAHFAGGELPLVLLDAGPVEAAIAGREAGAVILDEESAGGRRGLAARLLRHGWRRLDCPEAVGRELHVLVRPTLTAADDEGGAVLR